MTRLPRSSGILLHPTSLPGPFGIGDLGPEADAFVTFLADAGQSWWQVLPLGPTGFGNSPYQSHSSFAGNPLLISPELLAEDSWLRPDDWSGYPELSSTWVDFDSVASAKGLLLRRAFDRFAAGSDAGEDFEAFAKLSAHWLDTYALYIALKEHHGGKPWYDWEPGLAGQRPEALARAREELAGEIRFHQFVQFAFARQWSRLRALCRSRGVRLIGDLPIFVSLDSADVWSRPDLFELDERGRPLSVAGVPPDYFSETGQLWGNPVYRWDVHAAEDYAWWITRLKASMAQVDLLRIDHFRGFEAYWSVPADAPTAATGRWLPGPGADFFRAVRESFGSLPFIAEDLGVITPEVEALRDRFGMPGMRVLQFAFGDDDKANDYLPFSYIPHCVAYTGTHDNDTTVGWFTGSGGQTTQSMEVKEAERQFVLRYAGTSGEEIHWDLIRMALASVADTAIAPMQDVLGLGSEARMNLPGRASGNWGWRYRADQLDPIAGERLADMTAVYFRWDGPIPARFHHTPPRPASKVHVEAAQVHDAAKAAADSSVDFATSPLPAGEPG